MKKLVFLLLILLIFPIISAIEFDVKEEFSQGETLIAKVSGNFLIPLQRENVFFYREHVRIPVEYDIKKINNDYYIYALLLGKDSRNYSIALENIRYMQIGEVSEEDVVKNFTINNQTADFSVNPGFVSGGEFSLAVQNLKDKQITINVNVGNISGGVFPDLVILTSGQKKDIDFVF